MNTKKTPLVIRSFKDGIKLMLDPDAGFDEICDELAKGYDAADVGLPVVLEVSRDESDPDDIKVWGEFEYFTYNLVGDTLETQAGGSYPGCMHIKTTDAGIGYVVDHFDPVADGSDFDASAKEIFGDKYDAFMEIYSNDDLKNEKRKDFIEEYVFSHSVPATKYQDYGWDPVELNVSAGDPADDALTPTRQPLPVQDHLHIGPQRARQAGPGPICR